MELLVVMGIIAILVGLSMPALNALQKSYDSTGSESMIESALSTARTLAISNKTYAGVRFQKAYNKNGSQIDADQYMIFIVYGGHDITTLDCGFYAAVGYKPIKLPSKVSVMDKIVRKYTPGSTPKKCDFTLVEGDLIANELDDSDSANQDPEGNNMNITDTSAFSIVFSPAGKLVIYKLRCRNKDGASRNINSSDDDVFNTKYNVSKDPPTGRFVQDDFDDFGIGVENSRKSFVIYDRDKFKTMTDSLQRKKYLDSLKIIYINPYTGEIIK